MLTSYPPKGCRSTFPSGRLSAEDGLEFTLATLPSAGVLPKVSASRLCAFWVRWLCWSEVYFWLGLSASALRLRCPKSLRWGHAGAFTESVREYLPWGWKRSAQRLWCVKWSLYETPEP